MVSIHYAESITYIILLNQPLKSYHARNVLPLEVVILKVDEIE